MEVAIIDRNPETQFAIGNNYPVITGSLVQEVAKYKPDWVFVSRKDGFDEVRKAIKGIKAAAFYGDYRNPPPQHAVIMSHMCDITLINWKSPVWKYFKNPHVVTQGTSVKVFKPLPQAHISYDVAFGGNNYGGIPRQKVLEFLHKNFKLLVIGNGWPKNWNVIDRKGFIGLNRHLNTAKITVGAYNWTDYQKENVEFGTSNRTYQNMAVGRPHSAPYSKGIRSIFKHGYLDYKNLDDLGNKVVKLLSMTQEARDHIGQIQRNEIASRHTYAHTWQKIQKIVEENLF